MHVSTAVFQAQLRIGKGVPEKERKARVEKVLQEVSLKHLFHNFSIQYKVIW